MRKHQQSKILELLRTLGEAHGELRRQSAPEVVVNLLADCQEFARQIGEYIEQIEGEGTQAVSLLEEYCELVYHASVDVSGANHSRKLQAHLVKIENSVKTELLPNKIEVVFLSYNASMSDSLESIYLAAENDPDCNAFWIPIPYFDINADGSLGAMYYEGAERYGKNIVCTDWQAYDIEARHPDVIFTHYAYDDNVNNASIHPTFYSRRLREHCEILLYVPYFVAPGDIVEEYCGYLPGVLYAHHVIVESEAVRQSYIGHYKKFNKASGSKGRFGKAEEKFVALGSPKFDKVLTAGCEDGELPDEWKRLIYNPDGSRKKIVLYNTHMFAWINGGAAYFKKMRFVFDSFRSRDDVVLWWRPHPNTELNFRTKRPKWLDEYKAVVGGYKRGAWGIYDDTPDLHRAIAWSDVYYGDNSSVAVLYEKTGKSIIIQNIEEKYAFSEIGHSLPMTMCVADEGVLYYYLYHRNAIYQLDLSTLNVKYHGFFESKPIIGIKRDYALARIVDNLMFFIPFEGKDITVFDFGKNESKSFGLDFLPEYEMKNYGKFCDFIIYRGKVFLLPHFYSAIICFDLISGKTEHCLDLREIFKHSKLGKGDIRAFFYAVTQINESTILLPSARSNAVLEFHLDDYSYNIYKVGNESDMFVTMAEHNGDYWIVAINSPTIYKWNFQTKETDVYNKFPSGFGKRVSGKNMLWVWRQRLQYRQFLFLFPNRANMVCRLDMDNGEITRLDEFDKYCIRNEDAPEASLFGNSAIYGNKIYIWHQSNVILEYDIDKRSIRESQDISSLNDVDYQQLSNDYLSSFVSGNESVSEKTDDSLQTVDTGSKIYEYAKSLILK